MKSLIGDEIWNLRLQLIGKMSKINHTFVTNEEYDECEDITEKMAKVFYDKDGFLYQYLVISISEGGQLFCKGLYDEMGEEMHFELSDLDMKDLIALEASYHEQTKDI